MKNQSNPSRISVIDLKKNVLEINRYFDSLKNIYVGRDRVIDILKFAILQKSHILFFGVPGTAKTAIADSAFSGITGSKKFEVQMTAFMGEDAIFGPYNIKKMREEGRLEHNTEAMLPDAEFASLDEFLDANPVVLRSLLSALNERKMVKGRQLLDLPLHLAYCASNVDPYVFMKRNPSAWAVFDRIAFIDRIDYLNKPEDISEMVKRFQYRISSKPKETLDFSVIRAACDYILLPPTLIQDQIIFIKFAEAAEEYRQKRSEKMVELEQQSAQQAKGSVYDIEYQGIIFNRISDRRICWASHMLEVNAVLDGRIEVIPEDMLAAHYILGTSEIEKQIWTDIVSVKIQQISELKKNQLSKLQTERLQHFRDLFEGIRGNGFDIETRANGIGTLVKQVEEIKPENNTVNDLYQSLLKEINEYKIIVTQEFLKSKNLN